MELNIEVGTIIEDWYNLNSKKEYVVTSVPVNDKKYKYALVGMNGQVYLNKLFRNLKEIALYIDSQALWEVKTTPVIFNVQKDWNIKKSYGKHHTLETVLMSFINCFPGRWGLLKDKRNTKEKLLKNNYIGEMVIENGIVLQINIKLVKNTNNNSKPWICTAYWLS
ncbi:hypothetical protein [Bacillus sp. FDAARGOS_235]|uniref:hypothetical protein n=1 Tax=Bacillus sp. FDAARGOS_235 TaxID=1839798 RepID=UPI0011A21BEA|nr:hypothetical protein [Bacillus sp. FDAARGOS_235]